MKKLLLEEILELSVSERIQLAQDIWDSIATIPESHKLSEDQKADLRQRLQHYKENPESGISWEDLKARIQLFPLNSNSEISGK